MIEEKPFLELISPAAVAVISLAGMVLSSFLTYLLTKRKTRAEVHKTEAETERTELESLDKLRELVNKLAGDLAGVRTEQIEWNLHICALQESEKNLKAENALLSERLKTVEETIRQEQQVFQEMLSQKNKEIEGLKKTLQQTVTEFEKQINEKEKELENLRNEVAELKRILENHNLQIDN